MRPSNGPGKKRARLPRRSLPKIESPQMWDADATSGKGIQWTSIVAQVTGHPAAFLIVIIFAAAWLIFDRTHFDFNAFATLAVWIMTLLIQRSNRRDTLALHAKLDELLRVDTEARSELVRLDEKEPEEIEIHRDAEVRKATRLGPA